MPGHILIVEDRAPLRRLMLEALAQEGHRVQGAEGVGEARGLLGETSFDLVLTDLKLGDGTGIDVLATCRETQPDLPVIVLTAFGTVQTAVEAMKLGAVDFLEKPVEIDELYELARRHLGTDEPAAQVFEVPGAPPIIGRHPRFAAALRLLERVAPLESTVLLTGESGTGKELFARALHALSPRSTAPFIAVNCAAIPTALMENELFGHEKGAFTGAGRRQAGRFERASGGTIFLDEIGELELDVQGKVLRVLEEKTYERIGGGRTLTTDARVVAATNRDLETMSRAGEFRQDLLYRLDVFPIALPTLRDRASDIPQLVSHLTASICERLGIERPEISSQAVKLLMEQAWPGNIRQLSNLLERAVIMCESPKLGSADLEPFLQPDPAPSEHQNIRDALRQTAGDKRRAAELLGVSYRTLQRKIKDHDLEGFPRYRD